LNNQDSANEGQPAAEGAGEAVISPVDGAAAADATTAAMVSPRLEELRKQPQQGEMPFAVVLGKAVTELPKDLYIPPRALEVFLEAFEGPLDLLLYLIRRQNLDVLSIDVSEITTQYMQYVDMMDAMQFELAAEYLVMAAMLAEIKSRMLLPRSADVEDDEEDPRAQLIRRLQEYERFKKAAEEIEELPRMERENFPVRADPPDIDRSRPDPDVDMRELLVALAEVLRRADMYEHHQIQREALSTRERMSDVLDRLRGEQFVPFVTLFRLDEGRLGVVVTFLAIMELIKEALVEIVQTENFGAIHVKARIDSAVEGESE
jgi:segregation and condensation protein A